MPDDETAVGVDGSIVVEARRAGGGGGDRAPAAVLAVVLIESGDGADGADVAGGNRCASMKETLGAGSEEVAGGGVSAVFIRGFDSGEAFIVWSSESLTSPRIDSAALSSVTIMGSAGIADICTASALNRPFSSMRDEGATARLPPVSADTVLESSALGNATIGD